MAYPHLNLNYRERLLVDLSFGRDALLPSWNTDQWEGFFDLCIDERTTGLVYKRLKDDFSEGGNVPRDLFSRFKAEYQKTVALHWAQTIALEEIDSACQKYGLSLILFRGLALTDLIYRAPGLRPSIDIDLMPAPGSIKRVREILARLGFTSNPLFPNIFERPPVAVDLHHDLANIYIFPSYGKAFDYRPDDIWEKSVEFGNFKAVRGLSDADRFNFLVLHLVKHSFRKLIWWVDIYKIMAGMDDKALMSACVRAKEFRLDGLVGGILYYMGEAFCELKRPFPQPPPKGAARWLYGRMLKGKRFDWTGMLLYFFSIPEYRWRWRLVADKLARRGRRKLCDKPADY